MAGNFPVPQGAEVKLIWAWNTVPYALNILHFTHGVGAVMDQAKATRIDALVKAAFASSAHNAAIATGVTLVRVESRHMDSNSDPWFLGAGAAVAGVGAGNPLPAATAFVITLRTGLRGRSYNGRVYTWGWTEDANDAAGGITSTARSNCGAFIGTIQANMATQEQLTLGVLSRWATAAGVPAGTPPVERNPPIITPVTLVTALDSRWDVQRRRAVPGI